jgi:alpha-beta hydrolase superfamily lysophospholipase
MLFVGYDSLGENISGVAHRLRRDVPKFYPFLPQDLIQADETFPRRASEMPYPYRELVLVGHSLGGVIVRRALVDEALLWLEQRKAEPGARRPALLDAQVRLFSPASAGFRPAGWLGLWHASCLWSVANARLRRASAYTDLQPQSPLLVETRRRTEQAVAAREPDLRALQAFILWANPDNVVLAERYDTDHVDEAVDHTDHRSVCKPGEVYRDPWRFVETGRRS